MTIEERIQAYIDAMKKLKRDGVTLYNMMCELDEEDELSERQWEICDELENMDLHFECSLHILTGEKD